MNQPPKKSHSRLKTIIKKILPKGTDKPKKNADKRTKDLNPDQFSLIISIFGLLFSLFILSLIGIFFLKLYFKPTDLANLLPKDQTVFYLEFNLSPENLQKIERLSQNTSFKFKNITDWIKTSLNIDFEKELKPWAGQIIAFTFLKSNATQKDGNPLIFVHTLNQKKALTFLETLKLKKDEKWLEEKFENYRLFEYAKGQRIAFTFLNQYLVLASEKQTLKNFITSIKSKTPKLKNSPKYIEIKNNLPINYAAFSYLDLENAIPLAENRISLNSYPLKFAKPLTEIFPSLGALMVLKDKSLLISTYISINKKILKNPKYFAKQEKYTASLLNFVPSDDIYFLGGLNLEYQFKRILEIAKEKDPFLNSVLEAYLRKLKTNYFGAEIDLEKDIYPLFKDEFNLTISLDQNNRPIYTLIQKLKNPQADSQKIIQIKNAFMETNGFFEPYVIEKKSDSEKVQKEIVNPAGLINEFSSTFQDIEITTLHIPGLGQELNYAIVKDYLLISTSLEREKQIIASILNPNTENMRAKLDIPLIDKIKSYADEISYFDLSKQNFSSKKISTLFPMSYIFSSNNVFDDGISTIHYLRFKEEDRLKP